MAPRGAVEPLAIRLLLDSLVDDESTAAPGLGREFRGPLVPPSYGRERFSPAPLSRPLIRCGRSFVIGIRDDQIAYTLMAIA